MEGVTVEQSNGMRYHRSRMTDLRAASLAYHRQSPAGKLAVTATKPLQNQHDLALAYSPGVAGPVLAIAEHPGQAYELTNKGNLVAVISNGTAILGLGDRGALASKPVMEGKAVLFKRFAGVDAVDIELDSRDPQAIIDAITLMAPSFGAINLEDIKAPECFIIEQALRERLSIPVMHDDQHGTAVVVTAALINALHIQEKSFGSARVVVNGAGAAGIAICHMLLAQGVLPEHLTLCDSQGVLRPERGQVGPYKSPFVQQNQAVTLADALAGADVFIGVSKANCVTPDMIAPMAAKPVILALANPDPEITYPSAIAARPDAIVATGRSDFPNQVNNVLCFPFLFRGALDAKAQQITRPMQLACAKAIAELARTPVPTEVLSAYGLTELVFGSQYILPKPFDPRLLSVVAPAVQQAAKSALS